jgi:hypothetical protein
MGLPNCVRCGEKLAERDLSPRIKLIGVCYRCRGGHRRDAWRQRNPDKDRKAKSKWASSNPERVAEMKTAWRKANLERFNETGKAWKRRNPQAMRVFRLRQYGLTVEQYETLLADQGGCCAICQSTKPRRKTQSDFCIDHDHATGAVRGLLCVKCNAGLGNFHDDPGQLLAAERYIQKSRRLKRVV